MIYLKGNIVSMKWFWGGAMLMAQVLYVAVAVSSFSFQISGAAILLTWCLRNHDKQTKRKCIEQHSGSLWLDFDNTTVLGKEDLQQNAKTLYQNICAFSDLLFGYTCAIFVKETAVSSWIICVLVAVVTFIIIFLENTISSAIALRKYPTDQKVKLDNLR